MRTKIHSKYYRIPAYQTLLQISDEYMAENLGICVRSYKEKIVGYSDFSLEQSKKLSKILNRSMDDIFLT